MKKRILLPLLFLCLSVIGIYIFIPATFKVAHATVINASINGINRNLHDKFRWQAWWPSGHVKNDDSDLFRYKGYTYRIDRLIYNGAQISISKGNDSITTLINLVPVSRETVGFYWNSDEFRVSANPVERIRRYLFAGRVKNNMAEVIVHFQNFLQNRENIYDSNIHEIISKDSTLITTNFMTDAYPSTDSIYGAIKKLRDYAARNGAKEINFPMLSVRQREKAMETMVAISLDRSVPGNGDIIPKRFVPWKTLVGEIRGGPSKIKRGYEEMKVFTQDYLRTSMAIPFESLITDRTVVTDTSKWVTLICQPVS